MMTYSKDDVDFHSEYGRTRRPAVNVKVYGSVWDVPLPLDLRRYSDDGGATWKDAITHPRFDRQWLTDYENELDWTFDAACEDGWEWLQTLAKDTFGSGVKVYSEGRSGGWAIVRGLPDFDSWDAIMLGQWRRFERDAKATARAIPEDMLRLAYANVFEPWAEREGLNGC